jgi:hypothetical protein
MEGDIALPEIIGLVEIWGKADGRRRARHRRTDDRPRTAEHFG